MGAFPDTFSARELIDISGLMSALAEYNKQQKQMGAETPAPLWAEVVLFRKGEEVARITETENPIADTLTFEVTVPGSNKP